MKQNIPRSPFATRLSGSARETELRIRNIFSGPKKRPPVWMIVLVALSIVLCGGLVSCQPRSVQPEIVMDTQYYDIHQNYIEIPRLAMPDDREENEGVAAINRDLDELAAEYEPLLAALQSGGQDLNDGDFFENRCILYPTVTERYINLLFYRQNFTTDLNTGHFLSLVYDKETGRQVTLEDALKLADNLPEDLYADLAAQVEEELAQEHPDWDLRVQNQTLDAFRMNQEGQPVFYLTARTDDRDDNVQDYVSGAEHVYIREDGAFVRWNQYIVDGPLPVPEEELTAMDPPLWWQWHGKGHPEGGYADPVNDRLAEEDQAILALLYQEVLDSGFALDTSVPVKKELLTTLDGDGRTLGAAAFTDKFGTSLAIGVMDGQSGTLAAPIYHMGWQGGVPQVVTFQKDGTDYLLYTNSGAHQGYTYGDAGLITFDGTDFTWVWPVEGDIRDKDSQAYADYQTFWEGKKALMSPGGVEVFVENKEYGPYYGAPVQWTPDHSEVFYRTPEDQLPIGVMYQTRVWLEEFTRDQNNPWDAINTSALWRIVSMAQTKTHYDGQQAGELSYRLLAQADNDDDVYFMADLLLDEDNKVSRVVSWVQGSAEEIGLADQQAQAYFDRNQLILDYLREEHPRSRIYFLGSEPGAPTDEDIRIDAVTYLGESHVDGTVAVAYQLDSSLYYNHRQSADDPGMRGWFSRDPYCIVLSRDGDGVFQKVLGSDSPLEGTPVTHTIRKIVYHLLDADTVLYRDNAPQPIGPGAWRNLFDSALEPETVEVLEGWEPTYHTGDYWDRWTVEGFSALRYYNAEWQRFSINTIDVTRTDFSTPLGIRVGSSRADVLAAYPDAVDGDYWGKYPGEDLLYWTAWPGESELGPAILFFFEGDTVRQITLTDMFN